MKNCCFLTSHQAKYEAKSESTSEVPPPTPTPTPEIKEPVPESTDSEPTVAAESQSEVTSEAPATPVDKDSPEAIIVRCQACA